MNILDRINYLVEEECYTEEQAEITAYYEYCDEKDLCSED